MATEKINLTAPEELVGNIAEDAQTTSTTTETNTEAHDTTELERPNFSAEFADEEAALAADEAGLSIGEETTEEEEAQATSNDIISALNEAELIALFASKLESEAVQTLRPTVEAIKIAFYKLHRAKVEAERKAFIEAGGSEEAFTPSESEHEQRFKELFAIYRDERNKHIAQMEADKEQNLKIKLQIIEELKELVNSDETMTTTFTRFRELQTRWKETGLVPQANVKDLWETYNLHVENFYNFIKINKELRDLDLKKNYEIKISLCEQAEALTLDSQIVESFRKLQKLHDEWRETGPVAVEFKETLWERFKEASSRINKRHQEYFESIKAEQTKNLALKSELCEKVEAFTAQPTLSRKEWNKLSEELLEVQKTWKTIGYAPKKDNNRIYERFRAACDKFFERKAEHFSAIDSEHDENLKLKQALLEEMRAADVKAGGFDLIKDFQRRWSQIGFVPIKQKDALQKEYKTIVDGMFGVLRSSERDRSMNRFKERVQNMKGGKELRSEREKLFNKVRQMEQDIATLENNIGFFSKSKNAEALIADVREKIERTKRDMQQVIEKIKLIDAQENN